jgi:hypothetical protein
MANTDILTVLTDGQVVKRSGSTIAGATVPDISSGSSAPATTPGKVGDIYVDTTALVMYVAVGTSDSGDWEKLSRDANSPNVESGAGAPSSTPTKIGDIYIDTTNDVAYMATDTSDSGDWTTTSPATVTVPHYHDVTFPDTFTDTAGSQGIASAWLAPTTGTLVKAEVWCDTAPTNGSITIDLHKNGTTVFTGGTERPVIATSETTDVSGAPSVTTMAAGDLFQFQVDAQHASDEGNCGRLFCRIWWTESVSL